MFLKKLKIYKYFKYKFKYNKYKTKKIFFVNDIYI